MIKKYFWIFPVFLILSPAFFAGCGAGPSTRDAVAVVNGTPIGKPEFEKEITLRAAQDPSFKPTPQNLEEQLNLMINRKLLIDEAVDRKLVEDDRFKTSIRIFWEQTLIRLLMDSLSKDFEQTTSASEEEIMNYYSKLGSRVSFEIKRNKDKVSANNQLAAAKEGSALNWDEKLGPVTFDELNSPILEQAFELNQNGYEIYEKDGIFFLVHLATKEVTAPPALDTIRDKIMGKIKLRKQTAAFEEWFKEKKRKADIKMNLVPSDI